MRFQTLFRELHRRHVFKAGVAYAVVAWTISQVLSIMIPAFELPDELLAFSIVVMLVCFPIWLAISWFYDLTEDGIVRTKNLSEDEEPVSTKSVNLNKVIITSLSVLVILLIVNTFRMKAEIKNVTSPVSTESAMGEEELGLPQYKTSVAVLAFADMSPGQDHAYFAHGMSEEIIHKLAYTRDLKVIGRTSSFSYENKEVTHHTIAEELDVAYILEGSIRFSNDIVRITAQLIDVSDGSHIWSQTFDREIEDVLYTQDEIAKIVAEKLKVSLLNEDVRLRKVDPEAYALYLKASNALNGYNEEGTLIADSLIRRSLDIDRSYAPSWTVLSQVIFREIYHYFNMEPGFGHDEGVQAAMKALELDTQDALAHTWLAQYEWQNRRADLAEHHLITAIRISPNDPAILFQAGKFALKTNRMNSAKQYLDKAILLDPRNDVAYYTRGFLNWTLGNLDDANNDFIKAYNLDLPDDFKNYEMALLCRDKGKYNEAVLWMKQEENSFLRLLLKCGIYHAMGKKAEALELLEQIKDYPENEDWQMYMVTDAEHNYEIACLYAFMGDTDNAFTYLDKAFEHLIIWPERIFTSPEFKKIQGDHRWEAFLIRLGIAFNYDFFPAEQG